MYLREVDLDLSYTGNEEIAKAIMERTDCIQSEATPVDYKEIWKQTRWMFGLETRCVSSMFQRMLGKVKTEDFWKILVECVDRITDERILNLLGVYTVQVKFDYNRFAASTDYQKKQQALHTLMDGVRVIAEAQGWSLELFEAASKAIIEADYNNEWVWKKVSSRNRKYRAELLLQHESKYIDISIVLRDRNNTELARKKIITEMPDEWVYVKHLGKLKWLSESEVALINKEGDSARVVDFHRITAP